MTVNMGFTYIPDRLPKGIKIGGTRLSGTNLFSRESTQAIRFRSVKRKLGARLTKTHCHLTNGYSLRHRKIKVLRAIFDKYCPAYGIAASVKVRTQCFIVFVCGPEMSKGCFFMQLCSVKESVEYVTNRRASVSDIEGGLLTIAMGIQSRVPIVWVNHDRSNRVW